MEEEEAKAQPGKTLRFFFFVLFPFNDAAADTYKALNMYQTLGSALHVLFHLFVYIFIF